MTRSTDDHRRFPWLAALVLGLGVGAGALAARSIARAWEARRAAPAVPEERLRQALSAIEPRAIAYTRIRYGTLFLSEALTLAFFILLASKDRPVRLRRRAERIASRPLLRDALAGGGILALYTAVTLPMAFLSGFVVERAFGLSTQGALSWTADAVKSFGLSLALFSPCVAGLFSIIRRDPERWWLWAGGASALLAVALTNLAPVLIDPLFHRYTPLRDENLRRRLEGLARRAGIPVVGVYQADTSRKTVKANAYLTGIANTRRIVLTDTLLTGYSPDEIATVLAHELGHHHYGHIWKGILLGAAGTLAGFALADRVLRRTGARPGYRGKADVANLPALVLFLNIAGLTAAPAANTVSRAWESQCDRFAIKLTRDPRAFIGAMRKLSRQNLSDPSPSPVVEALLYDHPSIRSRILMALQWEAHQD